MSDVITVQRVIPAAPERVFDLLADPAGHARIDGGGTVRAARSKGPRRLALGDSFGMDMRLGVPYAVRNVVTEFEENRRIAWQVRAPKPFNAVVSGRTWRYELEPHEGGTLVRETWDNTTEAALARPITRRLGPRNRQGMTATLARIEELLTT